MKSKVTIKSFMAVFAVSMLAVGAPAQVLAAPYVEGGDIYRVRNITKNTDFSDPATADKCETLQYRVRIHNPGPDEALEGVTVQAAFGTAATTQNVSTIVIRATNADPSSTTDTATVNLSSAQKVTYTPGSTELLDSDGNFIRSIGDVTGGSGVSIGNVGISINEKRFVQFKATIDCPQPPVTPPEEPPVTPPVTPPTTPPSPIKPSDERQSPRPTPQSQPSVLPDTGAGAAVAVFASATTLATAGHYLVSRRFGR